MHAFRLPKQVKIVLGIVLIVAIELYSPFSFFKPSQAHAGSLSQAKVVINNNQASATGVIYSLYYTTSATTAIKQVNVLYCTTPSGSCTSPGGTFSTGSPTLASDNIAGTGRATTGSTTNSTVLLVTSPATQSTQTVSMTYTGFTNPTTANTSYYARITTYSDAGITPIDSTTVAFAILTSTSIAVTANVDPSFAFSIAGVTSGANFNGGTGNVTVTATDNTIPFGTLTAGTPQIAAQDLTVSTNASNGFTVTASASATPPLVSGANDIDAFSGTNASPTNWSAPSGTTANTNTGYFGYSTEQSDLCTGTPDRFTTGGPNWAGTSITGGEVMCSTAGTSSLTKRVGWQVAVNALQPAGNYTGTVYLIATPTY